MRFVIKLQKKDYIFLIGMLFICLLSVWKAKFGLGGKDVSLYINTPYRMVNGDKPFWDVWNLSQLSSIFLYPVMKIYMAFAGTSEAIMLHFRYIYIMVNMIIAIVIYIRLRKFGKISVAVTLLYAIFSPFNHTMLSYNSLGMMFGFLGVVLLATSEKNRTYFEVGLCYSIATLCQPMLALLYILMSIVLLIYCVYKKEKTLIKKWLIFTSACFLLALPIFLYVFIELGIEKLISCIPCMFMDYGVEHSAQKTIISQIRELTGALFPKTLYTIGGITVNTAYLMLVVYIGIIVACAFYVINRVTKKNNSSDIKCIYVLCILSAIASVICCFAVSTNPINIVCFPWIFPGIMAYFQLKNKKVKKLYTYAVIWGILHTISYLTSNGGMAVFSVALFPASILSLIVIYYVLKEQKERYNIGTKNVFKICIIITMLSMVFVRGNGLFWDKSVYDLTRTIEKGPAAGLRVGEKDFSVYQDVYEDITTLDYKEKKVLLLTERTWTYLITEGIPLSQYSTYLPGIIDRSIETLNKYYEINKGKKPELIYISKESLTDMTLDELVLKLQLDEYTIEDRENSYILYCD